MKIFLIGSFDSIYMYQYVKEVLLDCDFKTDKQYYFFHSGNASAISKEYMQLYEKVAYKIYYEKPYKRTNHSLIYALDDASPIDVVHIQYVKLGYLKPIRKKRRLIQKVILTAWGSDFLRLDNRFYSKMKKFIEMVDVVVAGTDNLRNFAIDTLKIKNIDKLAAPQFGSPIIEEIGRLKHGEQTDKNKISTSSKKIVIACGYNGKPEQQHINIIRALSEIREVHKSQIFLHLPVAYGLSDEYCALLKTELEKSGMPYKLDKKFYNPKEMAEIRLATDIFIHGQTTDASSSSVFEYIYADVVVINGRWLQYHEVDDYNLSIKEFNEFSEITNIVEDVLEHLEEEKKKVANSNEILLTTRSWSNLKYAWQELY